MDSPFFQYTGTSASKIDEIINSSTKINKNILMASHLKTNPWQRGVFFSYTTKLKNDSGKYFADRWMMVSDGNNIVTVEKDMIGGMQLKTVIQNKKFGYLQILPSHRFDQYYGLPMSLQTVMVSKNALSIKIAILGWTGERDYPTQPITAFNATGVNPTLSTSWSYIATKSFSLIDDNLSLLFFENFSIPVQYRNIAIFIWADDTSQLITNTFTSLLALQLEQHKKCTTMIFPSREQTLMECKQYYWQTYNMGTMRGTIDARGAWQALKAWMFETSLSTAFFSYNMWKAPVVTLYSYRNGTAGCYSQIDFGNYYNDEPGNASTNSDSVSSILMTGSDCGAGDRYLGHAIFEAELGV